MEKIRLRVKKIPRVEIGHLWIFSNELETVPKLEPGSIVEVLTSEGKSLGLAFYNPHSLIALRLLKLTIVDDVLRSIKYRILRAKLLREKIFPNENCYRLVYAESDCLPGLIIDRFADYFVVQVNSAGMEKFIDTIPKIITELYPNCKGIIAKNVTHFRKLEGLENYEKVLFGQIPEEVVVTESGVKYILNFYQAQKTGLFLDQKLNKRFIRRISSNLKVLDCYSNFGGFGLNAALGGAREVTLVDISDTALGYARRNFELNGLKNGNFVCMDALDFLRQEFNQNRKYDLVVLDPPSFTKSKKNVQSAIAGYHQINKFAMRIISDNGFLATASCSMHIDEPTFLHIIEEVAYSQRITLKLIYRGGQAPDHPILLSMPETRYLKFFVFQISKG
ncbi:MAG: 23S rRNA (cytosine(1962)-C(5))-methyltransferase [Candidatus Kapaibacterium sp.]|jgi:23S rRNA (cytosine1962-C5)-methyltransferase|nr:MAG: 23S rRNA (cytosine(1962)-C(5))-methyltransferase [Candidatus Kapabacteria bacterium]ROL57255.1 MAG: class I SAM-dependent rRNA methyltransferase [Bacteroidetes/Chlorobi group bacterium Naka2016]